MKMTGIHTNLIYAARIQSAN